jgi:hypothetical protein
MADFPTMADMGEKADLKDFRRAYRLKLRYLESELADDEASRSAAPEAVKPTWDQIVATRRITIAKLEEYIASIDEGLAALKEPDESSDVTAH